MVDILITFGIPVAICVVLPIVITAIVAKLKMNRDNKRTEIIIKAIESNVGVDTDKLVESLNQPQMSVREIQNRRLLRGCLFSLLGLVCIITACFGMPVAQSILMGAGFIAVGASYMIVYFVARKESRTPEDEGAE